MSAAKSSSSSPPPSAAAAAAAGPLLSNTSAFASLLTSSNHYGVDLWDSASSVAEQSESSRSWLTRVSKFLQAKAELDRDYSKSLKKLVLKLGIPDVPRVQDIPIPPSAAAAVAVALAANNTSAGTNLATKDSPAAAAKDQKVDAATEATTQTQIVDPRSFDRFMMAFRSQSTGRRHDAALMTR
jgi:hypothetical protein